MMQNALYTTKGDGWDSCLRALRHDVYHTAAYHRVSEASGEGQAFIACCAENDKLFAWPFLLREIDSRLCSGYHDVTCVYGYPGPVLANCSPQDPFLKAAAGYLVETWRSMRAVSVFSRFHPILANHDWAGFVTGAVGSAYAGNSVAADGIVPCGETVSIDLTPPEEICVQQYERTLRQTIAQRRRQGMTTSVDETWTALPEFMEIYASTLDRNGAAEGYYFSEEYFQRLRGELGAHVILAVTHWNGQVAAACVLLEANGFLGAHLGGPSAAHLRLSPFKILLDDARRLGMEHGDSVLHLGGGRGGVEDSLFEFKRYFSPRRHQYCIGRWILDSDTYRALCREHEIAAAEEGMEPAFDNYFPAYRTPLRERFAVHTVF